MKSFSALVLSVPLACTANLINTEYITLAHIREVSPDSFELIFDLNSNLAAQCDYTVPARELMINTDYFSFLRGYTNLGGRNAFYYKAMSQIRCDNPFQGFQQDLRQPLSHQ